jgi:CheY-like chemotaxis protein
MSAVLIVDDNDAVAGMLKRILYRFGFATQVAASLRDVAAILERDDQFDLIVLDWNIPTASEGALALTMLRTRHRDVPVVLSSGGDIELPEVAALPRLAKPYCIDDVCHMLEQAGLFAAR